MLKLKINVNLPQLLCIVISAAENGEFERFGGFSVDCYYTSLEGDKLVFSESGRLYTGYHANCLHSDWLDRWTFVQPSLVTLARHRRFFEHHALF